MAKRKVTLYTGKEGLSTSARNYLIGKKIEFEEIDTTSPEGIGKLIKNTRQAKTPFLEIKGSHSVKTSVGFDEFLYACALDSGLNYDRFLDSKRKEEREVQNEAV